MASTRLKNKPLLKINNKPIICHVVERAKETGIGEVFVATEDQEIIKVVEQNGGEAILTGKHETGTDRIFEAFKKLKKKDIDYVLNLQGDEPMINPNDIINLNNLMIKHNLDLGTLAAKINQKSILNDENVVKVTTESNLNNNNFSKALNFFRKGLLSSQKVYHHIGIYSYKASILKRFVNLSQTKNELKNKLEQLRAISNCIEINVVLAKISPIGVDTQEDYLDLKKIMEYKS